MCAMQQVALLRLLETVCLGPAVCAHKQLHGRPLPEVACCFRQLAEHAGHSTHGDEGHTFSDPSRPCLRRTNAEGYLPSSDPSMVANGTSAIGLVLSAQQRLNETLMLTRHLEESICCRRLQGMYVCM